MNRLILIGNGFDLAHGLKTSYKDFILDLFKKELIKTPDTGEKRSDGFMYNTVKTEEVHTLFAAKVIKTRVKLNLAEKLKSVTDFRELDKFIRNNAVDITFPQNHKRAVKGNRVIRKYPETIIKKTYDNIVERNYNWVDIEGMYYDSLLKIINVKDKNGDKTYNEDIKDNVKFLNSELDFLRDRFVEYIKGVMDSAPRTVNDDRKPYFWDGLKGRFIDRELKRFGLKEKEEEEHYPKEIQILNFNYTDTIHRYGGYSNSFDNREAHVDYNFIHGEINRVDNPIIFGYGDETDENYDMMEKLNDNELLRHIKSFGYFKADNYYKLLRFIKSGDYQVYIIGHSCGLSDRVMLKRIFEDKNCKSIQIFYYEREDGTDDYIEKTQEISRHFDKKDEMREKIVPKTPDLSMSKLPLVKFFV